MDDAASLIEDLESDAIQLRLESGELRFRAPVGTLSAARRDAIRRLHKDLVSVLRARTRNDPGIPLPPGAQRIWRPLSAQAAAALSEQPMLMHAVTLVQRAVCPARLERALNQLIRRHGALRTRYLLDAERELWAVTEEPRWVRIEYVDLRGLPEHALETRARQIVHDFVRPRFDLYQGPLLRMALVQGAEDLFVRVFVVHHSVFDGASRDLFVAELNALLASSPGTRLPDVDPTVVQFADFAEARHQWLRSAEAYSHLAYWREKLAGLRDPFWLPADRVSAFDDDIILPLTRGKARAAVTDALRVLAREEKTTLALIVLTVFVCLLSSWARRDDLLLWNFHHGRTEPGTEAAIGLFAEWHLLRFQLRRAWSFVEASRAVHASVVESLPHGRLSPAMLRPLLRRGGASVFPATTFNFLPHVRSVAQRWSSTERPLKWVDQPGRIRAGTPYALVITVTERQDTIDWEVQHKSALFEDVTIEKLSGRFGVLLAAVAANPRATLDALTGSLEHS